MENEQVQASYWPSVMIGAITIAIIMVVMSILSQYMMINSEPTGSSFNMAQMIGILVCFIAAIGGVISTRHFAKTNDITFPIGKGAVMGLLTGVIGVLISTVLALIWTYVVDPSLNQAVYDWQIANLEAQNMSQQQLEMAMGFIPEPGSTSALMWQVGIGLVSIGILNLISGIIGAKIFASEEE